MEYVLTLLSNCSFVFRLETIDFNVNKYGHLLIEFLLNSNMCILNGRNCSSNDFTCITFSGRSVVDFFSKP